ncbi:MAG: M50 family metallopeptidase [Acidobacteriaceae bacterium]
MVSSVLGIQGVIFAGAWWTVWRDKASGRRWGIAASLCIFLTCLLPIGLVLLASHRFIGSTRGILSTSITGFLVGFVGLVAFGRRCDSTSAARANPPVAGDGTAKVFSMVTEFLAVGAGYGVFYWWERWVELKRIPPSTTHIPAIVVFAVILLVIVALHELGHTVVGLALGMRLRAFLVGPLQWRIRNGKWAFEFKLAELLPSGGGTGMVPATTNFSLKNNLMMVAAGPLVTLLTGSLALWLAFSQPANSPVQLHGALALFAGWSLLLAVVNVIPFRTIDSYSDGATIYQLLAGGPLADYQLTMSIIGSSLVTPLRARDFDIEAIQCASSLITRGIRGMLLRLYAYMHYLDRGKMSEAKDALKEAESIYNNCAATVPAELHAEFVFGNAYLCRDPMAAREWWTRMEQKKSARFNVDYWKAFGALCWIEGDLREANAAWEKANAFAQQLPQAGAYEFDRYCCSLLRTAIDQSATAAAT